MKTIKLKLEDKDSFFATQCHCGKRYKNSQHKWYSNHIKECITYKEEERINKIGTYTIE